MNRGGVKGGMKRRFPLSSSIYTQVEEDRHTHIKNANQVAPAALARAGVCTTGIVASKFWIESEDRAR